MNTTSHYQLNQWDGPDRILRTDFNADNLKTDNAVAELQMELTMQIEALHAKIDALAPKAGAQLLKSESLSGEQTEINLQDIDWGAWKAVHISVIAMAENHGAVTLTLNGGRDVLTSATTITDPSFLYIAHVLFFPLFDARHTISAISLGNSDCEVRSYTKTYEGFELLGISCSGGPMLSGSKLEIWGEK